MTEGPVAPSHLERTPLHGEHLGLNARMVPFAGYEMPVHYPGGITAEIVPVGRYKKSAPPEK